MKTMRLLVDQNSAEGQKVLIHGCLRAWGRLVELQKGRRKREMHVKKMQRLLEDRRKERIHEQFVECFGAWQTEWSIAKEPGVLFRKIAESREALKLSKQERSTVVRETEEALENALLETDREGRLAVQTREAEEALRSAELENSVLHREVDAIQVNLKDVQRDLYDQQALVKQRDLEMTTLLRSLQAVHGEPQDTLEFGLIRAALANCLMLRAQNVVHTHTVRSKLGAEDPFAPDADPAVPQEPRRNYYSR